MSRCQREAEQSHAALRRAEDRAGQRETEVWELQRRLLEMQTVTPAPQRAGSRAGVPGGGLCRPSSSERLRKSCLWQIPASTPQPGCRSASALADETGAWFRVSPSGTAALHGGGRQFFRSCSARFRGVGSRGWQVGRAVPHQALPPGSWVRPGSVCPCRGTAPHRTSLACCSRAAVLGEGRSPGPVASPPLFFAPAPPGASGLTGEGQGRGDGPGGASEPER